MVGPAALGKLGLIRRAKSRKVRCLPSAVALSAGCAETCSSSAKEARWSNPAVLTLPLFGRRAGGVIPAFYPMGVLCSSMLEFGRYGNAWLGNLSGKVVLGQSGCGDSLRFAYLLLRIGKMCQIPSAGLWACSLLRASSFNAAGVGSYEPGDRPYRR